MALRDYIDPVGAATSLSAGAWQFFDQSLPGSTPISWGDIVARAIIVTVLTYFIFMVVTSIQR